MRGEDERLRTIFGKSKLAEKSIWVVLRLDICFLLRSETARTFSSTCPRLVSPLNLLSTWLRSAHKDLIKSRFTVLLHSRTRNTPTITVLKSLRRQAKGSNGSILVYPQTVAPRAWLILWSPKPIIIENGPMTKLQQTAGAKLLELNRGSAWYLSAQSFFPFRARLSRKWTRTDRFQSSFGNKGSLCRSCS